MSTPEPDGELARRALGDIRRVLAMAGPALERDPAQLPAQIVGRLDGRNQETAALVAGTARAGHAWLRPLLPSLVTLASQVGRLSSPDGSGITVAAVVPDGSALLAGTAAGTLCMWSLRDGTLLNAWELPQDAFDCDPRGLVQTHHFLLTSTGFGLSPAAPSALAPTAAGDGAIVASQAGRAAIIWDLQTGAVRHILRGHRLPISAVDAAPDGRVVTGGLDGAVMIWRVRGATEVHPEHVCVGHRAEVGDVRVTPDGRFVVSAGFADGTIRRWRLSNGESAGSIKVGSGVASIALLPDGRVVTTAVKGESRAQVWDFERGGRGMRRLMSSAPDLTLEADEKVQRVASSPGRGTVVGTSRYAVWVWDVGGNVRLHLLANKLPDSATRRATCCPITGAVFSYSGNAPHIERLDPTAASGLPGESASGDPVIAADLTPDGTRAVFGTVNGRVLLWNVADRRMEAQLEGHTAQVTCAAIDDEAIRAITGDWDGKVIVWDLSHGVAAPPLPGRGKDGGVWCSAITGDGHFALTGSKTGVIRGWDLQRNALVFEQVAHAKGVRALAMTPDGRRAVSAGHDNVLRLWEPWERPPSTPRDLAAVLAASLEAAARGTAMANGRIVAQDAPLLALGITAEGTRAVGSSPEGAITVWNLETGDKECTVESGHAVMRLALGLGGSGQLRVAIVGGRHIELWEPASGRRVAGLLVDGEVDACAASRDCRTIVAGDASGAIHLLALQPAHAGEAARND